MPVKLERLPIDAQIAPKYEQKDIEKLRQKAKVVLKEYDEKSYIGGIMRGNRYVLKFILPKEADGKTLTAKQAEKAIRDDIMAGEYDRELTEVYDELKAKKAAKTKKPRNGRKRRTRKPKTP